MNRVLLYLAWAFGLALCFTPYLITSQLYQLKGPEWTANWEGSGFAQKRLSHISGFLASIPLSSFYVYVTWGMVKKLAFDLARIQQKSIIRKMEIIIVLSIVTFVASGGLAFITVFFDHSRMEHYNPKEVGFTPIAMFLIIMGLMGVLLLILAPRNFNNGMKKLARIQLYVGGTFLVVCYGAFELLLRLL